MNVNIKSKASGKIDWLRVYDKRGNLKHELRDIPNIILNAGMINATLAISAGSAFLMTSTAESFEDLGGTWNQTGNTVTRATGSATFPLTPSQLGQELRWNTGERCHVTARASDMSITVSGPARTITGGTIRRFDVNGGGPASSSSASIQTSASSTELAKVWDDTAGTFVASRQYNFNSAVSAYSLGSVIMPSARIKLPAPISIDIEDQVQFVYTLTETVFGRSQTYEMGAETLGLPQKYPVSSIVGNGTNVDVTFSGATHFLAGDKLDLRGVVPKRFAISSASSTSTTFTINTTAAHGLSVSDSVVIEGASLAGYNGTHTVATVVDSDTITITNAANPGALGASGTIRLATPGTYFDDLGLATIASMVSTSVARITSAITGPAADSFNIGGDPGVDVRIRRNSSLAPFILATTSAQYLQIEANAQALLDVTTTGSATGGTSPVSGTVVATVAGFANDWTASQVTTWNAGTGTGRVRVKQFLGRQTFSGDGTDVQITLKTPFTKAEAQRLRLTTTKQLVRDLP
jgi:hypothetical protein